jgi:cell division septation protein DedD
MSGFSEGFGKADLGTAGLGKTGLGKTVRLTVTGMALLALGACAEGQGPGFLKPKGDKDVVSRAASGAAKGSTERDVEAPEIFQTTEAGLWDGRPSLGGVWVAHPDVKEPERAIIRNEQNGQFVIGALFKRERQSPGPRLQMSSDAAAALGVLAGQPTNVNVVALRREEVSEAPAPKPTPVIGSAAIEGEALPAAPTVSEGPLDPVAPAAATALEAAPLAPASPQAAPAPAPEIAAAAPAPKPAAAALKKPYIQIGIFSVEQNAQNTATAMRQAGMVPTVKTHNSQGKEFWRVVVGPAQTKAEMETLLKTIKDSGFTDAYAVTN